MKRILAALAIALGLMFATTTPAAAATVYSATGTCISGGQWGQITVRYVSAGFVDVLTATTPPYAVLMTSSTQNETHFLDVRSSTHQYAYTLQKAGDSYVPKFASPDMFRWGAPITFAAHYAFGGFGCVARVVL